VRSKTTGPLDGDILCLWSRDGEQLFLLGPTHNVCFPIFLSEKKNKSSIQNSVLLSKLFGTPDNQESAKAKYY
jgi:hypothetical protein